MASRMAFFLCIVVLTAGCEDEPMTADEIYHFKTLHDRPTEIDSSLVESFELQINDEDGFTGHPRVKVGEPIRFTGRVQLKEGVLTEQVSGKLRAGYRKVESGVADWSIDTSSYQEFLVANLRMNEIDPWKIDHASTKKRLKPGHYELRYYLLLEKFNINSTDEYIGIYYLADGQLEILPGNDREADGNSE